MHPAVVDALQAGFADTALIRLEWRWPVRDFVPSLALSVYPALLLNLCR
ncbi:hypothetical protein [uncultured Stenotrophomonas sp.]|nr:hypothetical protein [uncultured Stenotrophomonas sp.]